MASGPTGESMPMAKVWDFGFSDMCKRPVEALGIEDRQRAGHAAADISRGAALHLALAGRGMQIGQAFLWPDAAQHQAARRMPAHRGEHGAAVLVLRGADDDDL